jgi:two-component system, response regulator RegA
MAKSVLLLDDDVALAKSLSLEFEDHGYSTFVAYTLAEIKNENYAYAVIDLRLAGEYGLDAIDIIKKYSPHCRIVVLSGYGSIATVVEVVKRGAVDYLTKPAGFKRIEAVLVDAIETEKPEFKDLSLSRAEHEYIDFVLVKNRGNISKTAKALGLHRQSLQRKLKKYT